MKNPKTILRIQKKIILFHSRNNSQKNNLNPSLKQNKNNLVWSTYWSKQFQANIKFVKVKMQTFSTVRKSWFFSSWIRQKVLRQSYQNSQEKKLVSENFEKTNFCWFNIWFYTILANPGSGNFLKNASKR